MNKKAFIPISALMGALLLALFAAMTPFVADPDRVYAQTATIEFAENGDGVVATFTAEDPEGATPIYWSLANATQVGAEADLADADNADADDFMIDDEDGTLKFNIAEANDGSRPGSPDFENGQGSGTGNNTYKVVVVACDVELAGDPAACPDTGEAGYHKVTVMVTDVVEAGKVEVDVTVAGNDLQFRSTAVLTATVSDGDIAGATKTIAAGSNSLIMRWYRGSTLTDDTDNNLTYTVVPADVGHSIRAVATYRVGSNQNQDTASWMSAYPVIAERIGDNKLKFDPDMLERSVAEGDKGMMVGAPVRATGNHGAVVYSLPAGDDNAKFKIDERTGQITTMEDLNREHTAADADPNFGCGANYQCVVKVRATDATSATDATASTGVFADATVTVKLTNVDEKPEFTSGDTAVSVAEGSTVVDDNADSDGDAATGDSVYAATDPEGLNVNLALMGSDASHFSLSSGGVLSFRAKPDYEMPGDADMDNVYEVTVRASDGTMTEDRMVMVTVTEVDEAPVIRQGDAPAGGSRDEAALDAMYGGANGQVDNLDEVTNAINDYFDRLLGLNPNGLTLEEVNIVVNLYFDRLLG